MASVKKRLLFPILVIGAVLVLLGLYLRPVPAVQAEPLTPSAAPDIEQAVPLPWPKSGQASLGAVGYGVLADNGAQTPVPIASTAKVMTALAVLDKKPLLVGNPGPLITISADDVQFYQQAKAQGESVLPVATGEQISEYQALQAMLIPSANNIAYTVATWAFGSLNNYLAYANQKAKTLGMGSTTFADASGFSPQTVGTANDLVLLGQVALKNDIIATIVSQTQAQLPLAGTVKNVNSLLLTDGVVGIKTGNTDQAGGCFLLAAKRTVGGRNITVLTATVGSPTLNSSLVAAKAILDGSDGEFINTVINTSRTYKAPWGANSTAKSSVSLIQWRGKSVVMTYKTRSLAAGSPAGTLAGYAVAKNGGYTTTAEMHLAQEIKKPNIWWRIFR